MRSETSPDGLRAALSAAIPHGQGIAAVLLAAAAVLALLLPLPALVVDLLLAVSVGVAAGALLIALGSSDPVRLTSMPPLLVLASLGRIVLCVCVSRLILATGGAGTLVPTLADVVGGGDAIAGVGLLVVLAVVQVVMVTSGVGRMAEVAARFALDALPGKQMGLDTAVGAGHLSAERAQSDVRRLEDEANFYGAMDGAGRLLRGEAVATIAIVLLTAVVGAARAVGGGEDLAAAAQRYALLATGQGLVTLLPALAMAAAAAMMVTRSATASPLLEELGEQLLVSPWPLAAAGVALIALGLLPGVAKVPTLVMGAVMGVAAWVLSRTQGAREAETTGARAAEPAESELVLEVGLGLLDLVEGPRSLMTLLPGLREAVGEELGLAIPPIMVRDSLNLRATEYTIVFRAGTLARGSVRPGRELAVAPGAGVTPDVGRPADLADGREGVWVTHEQAHELSAVGYELLTPQEALCQHLGVVLRRHADELFDVGQAAALMARVRRDHPALASEANAAGLSVGLLRRVCAQLLWMGVPLRDPLSVLEGMLEALPETTDAEEMALAVRPRLAGMLSDHLAVDGRIRALVLAPELEVELADAALREGEHTVAALEPSRAAAWVEGLDHVGREHGWGRPLAAVAETGALLPLQSLCRQARSELTAVRAVDLAPQVEVEQVARLDPEQLH